MPMTISKRIARQRQLEGGREGGHDLLGHLRPVKVSPKSPVNRPTRYFRYATAAGRRGGTSRSSRRCRPGGRAARRTDRRTGRRQRPDERVDQERDAQQHGDHLQDSAKRVAPMESLRGQRVSTDSSQIGAGCHPRAEAHWPRVALSPEKRRGGRSLRSRPLVRCRAPR